MCLLLSLLLRTLLLRISRVHSSMCPRFIRCCFGSCCTSSDIESFSNLQTEGDRHPLATPVSNPNISLESQLFAAAIGLNTHCLWHHPLSLFPDAPYPLWTPKRSDKVRVPPNTSMPWQPLSTSTLDRFKVEGPTRGHPECVSVLSA